jgi:O-antigen/teichoic acid export membrane protein
LFKRLFSFGGWITLSSIANPLFYYLERFVIASTLTVGVLTYYAIPYEVISRLVIVPASFAATLFPAFSYYGSENQTKIKHLLSRPIKYLTLIAGPVVAIFIAYAHQILALWLGEEFAQQGARVLQILALTFFFHALAHVPFTAIQGLGRPDLKAKFDMVMLLVFTGLCFWLVPQQGIIGAAVAKFILTCADVTFLSWMVLRLSKLSASEVLADGMEKASLLVGSFAVVNITLAAVSPSLLVDFLILGGSICAYIVLLFLFIADEKDKEAFRSVQRYFLSLVKNAR